jgi:signal transduction histidine kinase
MWAIIRDITARKAAEKALRQHEQTFSQLVERAPFGIYVVDSQLRIAHMNIGSQRGTFGNVHPVIGRDFSEAMRILWSEPVAAGIITAFRRTLDTGEPYFSPRFTNPRADVGRTESYEWELHRIVLPDGQYGVVCYYFDSTELRNAEEALRNADRRKDEFLATLAHELRNPLAPIRQAAAIGRSAVATPAQIRWGLEVIERQTRHMAALLDELLDVSRITRGRIKLDIRTLVLDEVVEAAIETARPHIESCSHRLDVALPKEALALNGDPLRLAQVLSNLLTNAAKYTEPGGKICLSARRDGDAVEIAVADNGVGIAPEQLEHVFEMFGQGHAPSHLREGGLGIGLALARGLVVLHGGTIEARSDGVGRGSTFVVRLPLACRTIDTQHDAARDSAVPRCQKRILVVDDNADAADSLATLLRLEGHEVEVATDGTVALRVAGVFRPDVVLLDLGMPGVSGLEVARRLRSSEEGRGALLVAITGWGQAEDRRSTEAAGFDYHLTKPVDPEILAEIIARPLAS